MVVVRMFWREIFIIATDVSWNFMAANYPVVVVIVIVVGFAESLVSSFAVVGG